MQSDPQSSISDWQAARLIYQTDRPTRVQLFRVRQALQSGRLKGSPCQSGAANWTTTRENVAAFLAHREIQKRTARYAKARRKDRGQAAAETGSLTVRTDPLNSILETSLRNYILHVVMLRRDRSHSRRLRLMILGGQIAALLLIGGVFASTIWATRSLQPPPEHALIHQWLEEHTDQFRVEKIHPAREPRPDQAVYRVEYHYRRPPGKGVDTVQYFTISGGRVTSVDSDS